MRNATELRTGPGSAKLGKLGIVEDWQTALLLPNSWDDLRTVISDFSTASQHCGTDIPICVEGMVQQRPQVRLGQGAPRLIGTLTDPGGRTVSFVLFGDTAESEQALQPNGKPVVLRGKLAVHRDEFWLSASEIVEGAWAGKLRPKYAGKPRVIRAETVRDLVVPELVEHVPPAARWLVEGTRMDRQALLSLLGEPGVPLERILYLAHLPRSVAQGRRAQNVIEVIAALAVLNELGAHQDGHPPKQQLDLTKWRAFSQRLPFQLTKTQNKVVCEILADMSSNRVMRRILSGDVGSGKTAVFSVVAAAVVAGGGRVAILAPGDVLAEQTYQTVTGWWPRAVDSIDLVTGSTAPTDTHTQKPWLIGTTALLHRETGEFDLVIVDEQQRFSRAQREALVSDGTHLLEVSATCIPRSLGLVKYGSLAVSHLQQEHVAKRITTKLALADQRVAVFNYARRAVQAGEKVLVIYPRREGDNSKKGQPVRDVESAVQAWESVAPGRVRHASGACSDEENTAAVNALKEGSASVLLATTVVEVGIDIPDVSLMIVVSPERYGLSALHQLRGRLARAGGEGQFIMYAPDPLSPKSRERLQIMVVETDGMRVAEADLRLRGFGDLTMNSSEQAGTDGKFLFGRPLTPERVEEAIQLVNTANTA